MYADDDDDGNGANWFSNPLTLTQSLQYNIVAFGRGHHSMLPSRVFFFCISANAELVKKGHNFSSKWIFNRSYLWFWFSLFSFRINVYNGRRSAISHYCLFSLMEFLFPYRFVCHEIVNLRKRKHIVVWNLTVQFAQSIITIMFTCPSWSVWFAINLKSATWTVERDSESEISIY